MNAQLDIKSQNYSIKRILHDWKEIQEETVKTVGVSAEPLENDLYIWHANIKGPKDTKYEGGVFHFQIDLPHSYPHKPPKITLYTPIDHPNVFGNHICLDMLQEDQKELYQGWSSAYTIQSILIQLQSFLFVGQTEYQKAKELQQ